MNDKQEQWSEYLQEYNSKLQEAKQHVDNVVNSSTATQEEKNKARSDYTKQLSYYNILQNVYNESVEAGTFPDTFNIDSNNSGSYSGIYRISGDDKIYISSITACNYEEICASSEHFSVFWKVYVEEGGNIIDLPDFRPESTTVYPGYGQDSQGVFAGWVYDSTQIFYMWVQTKDNNNFFTTTWRHEDVPSGTHMSFFAAHIYAGSSIPTFTRGENIYRTSMFGGQALSITLPEGAVSTNNPWDYYNDNILPDIAPENAAFPDGYHPIDPDQPQEEPEDLPHDDGEEIQDQPDRAINAPTLFITQYPLTQSELETVGANLWQSWLTPNTDVWKNFLLPYSADFGTLNMSAVMEAIISLRIYPFEFTIDWFVDNPMGVRMGTGHTDFLGSHCPVIKTTIISLYAGECTLQPEVPYNDFRDMYNCSVTVFLPYCGNVELNPVEVIGRKIKAWYYIDLQSGGCTGVIKVVGDKGEYNVASKSGQIGVTIPLTATNAGQLAAQFIGDATSAVKTVDNFWRSASSDIMKSVTGLLSAQSGKSNFSSPKENPGRFASNLSGNTVETTTGIFNSARDAGYSLAEQALDMLSRSGIDIPYLSGGSGAESFMFSPYVYAQIRRGKYAKPDNYPHSVAHLNLSSNPISYYKGKYNGTPSTGSDTDKGFCVFTNVDTSGLDCREDERAEIVALLESGIYL